MRRHRDGEALVFAAATAVALVHALDDAFVHRGPGLGLGQHALAGAIAIAAAVGAILAFPRVRPGLRAALAFSFGALALVNGATHAIHVGRYDAAGADLTGVAAAAAGVVLVALAAAIPWRHRDRRGVVPRGRRWARRAGAALGGLLGLVLVLGPIGMGVVATHKWREPIGAAPPAFADVRFRASDGLELAGWYRPSRNGAAVLVVHGGSSDRNGAIGHARMLARHGYGVLVYDARGRGRSEGRENNYGWDWPKDVAGALEFLRRRDDVDPTRIGALGLSTGADVLIEVAATRRDIAAVVADGTAAASYEDWHRLRGTEMGAVPGWVMFTTVRVLSGDRPGPALEDLAPRIDAPTLLVSAGTAEEREFSDLYERAAGGRIAHWNLPDARHTRAIHSHRAEYERRVVGHFDAALR
jgi:uncharacterized protein